MFGVIGGLITLAFLYLTKFCVLVVMQVNCIARVQPPELAALVSQTDTLYMLYTCMYIHVHVYTREEIMQGKCIHPKQPVIFKMKN